MFTLLLFFSSKEILDIKEASSTRSCLQGWDHDLELIVLAEDIFYWDLTNHSHNQWIRKRTLFFVTGSSDEHESKDLQQQITNHVRFVSLDRIFFTLWIYWSLLDKTTKKVHWRNRMRDLSTYLCRYLYICCEITWWWTSLMAKPKDFSSE